MKKLFHAAALLIALFSLQSPAGAAIEGQLENLISISPDKIYKAQFSIKEKKLSLFKITKGKKTKVYSLDSETLESEHTQPIKLYVSDYGYAVLLFPNSAKANEQNLIIFSPKGNTVLNKTLISALGIGQEKQQKALMEIESYFLFGNYFQVYLKKQCFLTYLIHLKDGAVKEHYEFHRRSCTFPRSNDEKLFRFGEGAGF